MLAVLTTIQGPTASVLGLVKRLEAIQTDLIVIGDKKGPFEYPLANVQFYSLQSQLDSPFELARLLPTGHYGRKNVGYLLAIQQGADCIYETDDDNAPNAFWEIRQERTTARKAKPQKWSNVYRMFSEENIWPRGFPLRSIGDAESYAAPSPSAEPVDCLIQQGLADISPDVDAVWRLTMDREFHFPRAESVWLPPGTWCPFNSQTTWWWPAAYPLLYLPNYCSFRMTDIWRSFVAQRCLWELKQGLVFHAPEVDQLRNEHNLLRDFEDEIDGYLKNEKIVDALEALTLKPGLAAVSENMRTCYAELVRIDVLPAKEMPLIEAWLSDLLSIETK